MTEKELKLQELEKEKNILLNEYSKIDKKLLKLNNKISNTKNSITNDYIDTLPEIDNFEDEHWEWILNGASNSGSEKYNIRNTILSKLCVSSFGYIAETNQPQININSYIFDKNKTLEGLNILCKYLKPANFEDIFRSKETGIRIFVHDIEDNVVSVLYIYENKSCKLYIDKYDKPKKFETLENFIEWYDNTIKEI